MFTEIIRSEMLNK